MDFEHIFDRWVARALDVIHVVLAGSLLVAGLVIGVGAFLVPGSDFEKWVADNYAGALVGLLTLVAISGGTLLLATRRIEKSLKDDALTRIDERIRELSGAKEVFAPDLRRASNQLRRFFDDGVFMVYGLSTFQSYWTQTIRGYKPSKILATSLPTTSFFWNVKDVHDATRENIVAGGDVTRLFFVSHEEPTEPDLAVMRAQAALGVHVYYCPQSMLPEGAFELALVDEQRRFGWRVNVSGSNFASAEVFTSRDTLDNQYKRLEALLKLKGVTPLTP